MERRSFVKTSAVLSAAAVLPGFVYANVKGSDRIKIGLIGCGGRGTGAVINMLSIDGNVEIVAVADLFPDKIAPAIKKISEFAQKKYGAAAKDIIDPDKVKKFSGWDCVDNILKENIDSVIEATPPVFRTPHYEKIVAANKHAFLEKPACVDITQGRRMAQLAEEAQKKGLSVVTGNQRRYHDGYRDVIARVQNGEIGEFLSAQCYWNSSSYVGESQHDAMEKAGILKGLAFDDAEYQIRNWFSFIWASGDNIVEQHVHNIDVIMWALGDNRSPIDVRGWGGRSTDLPVPMYGDRFSHFAIDYDMGDGLRLASYCQQDPKCSGQVLERIVGTKGIMETDSTCKITDHKGKVVYVAPKNIPQAYEMEHKYLLDSIRSGQRLNTLKPLIHSNLVAIAGRMSAYTGQKFKYGWMQAKSHESLALAEEKFGKKAIEPVPVPGKNKLV